MEYIYTGKGEVNYKVYCNIKENTLEVFVLNKRNQEIKSLNSRDISKKYGYYLTRSESAFYKNSTRKRECE